MYNYIHSIKAKLSISLLLIYYSALQILLLMTIYLSKLICRRSINKGEIVRKPLSQKIMSIFKIMFDKESFLKSKRTFRQKFYF
jgi:hypothetical protein